MNFLSKKSLTISHLSPINISISHFLISEKVYSKSHIIMFLLTLRLLEIFLPELFLVIKILISQTKKFFPIKKYHTLLLESRLKRTDTELSILLKSLKSLLKWVHFILLLLLKNVKADGPSLIIIKSQILSRN